MSCVICVFTLSNNTCLTPSMRQTTEHHTVGHAHVKLSTDMWPISELRRALTVLIYTLFFIRTTRLKLDQKLRTS